tara:strand:- start:163 stop:357 length:195 start_codon:yes stop_codon:yes gene_type:complete
MTFKMKGPSLYKKPVGPIATKVKTKITDEEDQVMENMENRDLMSDKVVHDIVKSKINKKKNNVK